MLTERKGRQIAKFQEHFMSEIIQKYESENGYLEKKKIEETAHHKRAKELHSQIEEIQEKLDEDVKNIQNFNFIHAIMFMEKYVPDLKRLEQLKELESVQESICQQDYKKMHRWHGESKILYNILHVIIENLTKALNAVKRIKADLCNMWILFDEFFQSLNSTEHPLYPDILECTNQLITEVNPCKQSESLTIMDLILEVEQLFMHIVRV